MVQDLHHALDDLSRSRPESFDAIVGSLELNQRTSPNKAAVVHPQVTDVGHNIKLDRKDLPYRGFVGLNFASMDENHVQDMHYVTKLLKPDGLLVENLSTPSYAADQLLMYKEFLGQALLPFFPNA